MKSKKVRTFSLNTETVNNIEKLANQDGRTLSGVIDIAIRKLTESNSRKKKRTV